MDEREPGEDHPPIFKHPSWTIGIVVVLGAAATVAGLENPIWWLIGAPCILTTALYLWVRFVAR